MSDALFQNLSTVQNSTQPTPVRITATTTIAPSTFLTRIIGTTAITTIVPPVTGQHMLAFIFTTSGNGIFLTTGNVQVVTTTVVAETPILMIYDPVTAKYYQLFGK